MPSENAIIGAVATLIVAILTVGGGMAGRWYEQRYANRRPFLERQLALCFEAVELCSRLATETEVTKWEEARAAFWRLYWGPLCMVEDRRVEKAMIAFGALVPGQAPSVLPIAELRGPAYALANAARNLVIASWRISLPELGARAIEAQKPISPQKPEDLKNYKA